jgi:hypothetical protein
MISAAAVPVAVDPGDAGRPAEIDAHSAITHIIDSPPPKPTGKASQLATVSRRNLGQIVTGDDIGSRTSESARSPSR